MEFGRKILTRYNEIIACKSDKQFDESKTTNTVLVILRIFHKTPIFKIVPRISNHMGKQTRAISCRSSGFSETLHSIRDVFQMFQLKRHVGNFPLAMLYILVINLTILYFTYIESQIQRNVFKNLGYTPRGSEKIYVL